MNKFEMSPKTKRKAIRLLEEIKHNLEISCYFLSNDKIEKLNDMIKRHIRKELK